MTPLLYALVLVQQAESAGRPCRLEIDSVGRLGRSVEVAAGPPKVYNYFAGGGVWARCQGTDSRLAADSVAWYGREARLDLMGNVRVRDELMDLDASTARYHTKDERLEAHRNVVAVNRSNGTVLRGPNLIYLRAVQGVRDTTEMFASSRPTIDYRTQGDTTEPYVIVADRVRMKGNERMWASGRVTVDRSDLAARADSMQLDESADLGVLLGKPRIEAEDWRLTGDTIHLVLREGKLHQTLAWGRTRPRAFSTRHTVEGDSLALDTPGEVLTEVRAFGSALSTSRRDTTAGADLDWIAGDTLVARFVPVASDTGGRAKSELQEIIARGSARSLAHLTEAGDSAGPPDINYSRGTSIAVKLQGDRIDRVLVSGRADGVHLEKRPPAPAAPTDTAPPRARP